MKNSSSSFDFNSNEAAVGCLSGLLRRLLCKNFHQSTLHYRNQFVYSDVKQLEEKAKTPPSPCLVARLMGLDTMPVHPYTPAKSMSRSRSTNSIETWNGFLSGQKNFVAKHMTSQSCREEPTFLRKENEDFFVLSFYEDREETKKSEEDRKSKIEKKVFGKGNIRVKNLKLVQEEVVGRKPRQIVNVERTNKAKKKRKEPRRPLDSTRRRRSDSAHKKVVEAECSSQNSSPVSVLDRHLDIDGPGSPISEEKMPNKERPSKKIPSELKSESFPSPKPEVIIKSKQKGLKSANNAELNGRRSAERNKQGVSDAWGHVCHLAEEDVKRSCWGFRDIWRLQDNNEDGNVAAAVGHEALDFLISELLTELSA